jgi:hypothetical protein
VHKKEFALLACIDVLMAAIVLLAYFDGSFTGSSWMGALAIGLPIVFNLAYLSEHSGIRLNAPQEPLSLMPAEDPGTVPRRSVRTSEDPKTGLIDSGTPEKIWALAAGTILVILIAALSEAIVRKVSLSTIWPVPALTISLVATGFSFARNCWKTSWAEADPGINLLRAISLGLLSLTVIWVVYMAVQVSLGTPDGSEMNSSYLQYLLGLALIRSYSYKIGRTVQA